jgi:hypothetical protein
MLGAFGDCFADLGNVLIIFGNFRPFNYLGAVYTNDFGCNFACDFVCDFVSTAAYTVQT